MKPFEKFSDFNTRFYKMIPLLNAGAAVHRRLQERDCPPCNPKAFELFIHRLALFNNARDMGPIRAKQNLFHPTPARALKYCQLMQSGDAEVSNSKSGQLRAAARDGIPFHHLRAAYILLAQGQHQGAKYLEDLVERKAPGVWVKRKVLLAQCERDARLSSVRANAESKDFAHHWKVTTNSVPSGRQIWRTPKRRSKSQGHYGGGGRMALGTKDFADDGDGW